MDTIEYMNPVTSSIDLFNMYLASNGSFIEFVNNSTLPNNPIIDINNNNEIEFDELIPIFNCTNEKNTINATQSQQIFNMRTYELLQPSSNSSSYVSSSSSLSPINNNNSCRNAAYFENNDLFFGNDVNDNNILNLQTIDINNNNNNNNEYENDDQIFEIDVETINSTIEVINSPHRDSIENGSNSDDNIELMLSFINSTTNCENNNESLNQAIDSVSSVSSSLSSSSSSQYQSILESVMSIAKNSTKHEAVEISGENIKQEAKEECLSDIDSKNNNSDCSTTFKRKRKNSKKGVNSESIGEDQSSRPRNFVCSFKDCKKSYLKSSHLKQHVRSHTGKEKKTIFSNYNFTS